MLLLWGSTDSMINLTDLHLLLGILPEEKLKVIRIEDYNHVDYMWAKDT